MSIRDDINMIDAGEANSSAFHRVHAYLLNINERDGDLYDAISVYLEEAPMVDWRVAEKFVRYPDDPLVAAAAINAGGLRSCPNPAFWSAVADVAAGEAWDSMDDARIQALLALNRSPTGCTEKTKKILRASLNHSSPAVRDSAAIAAQRCFGIPENKLVAAGEPGGLAAELSKQVLEWLQADKS